MPEPNIPLPSPENKRLPNGITKVLREMEIGDSAPYSGDPSNIYNLANRVGIKVSLRRNHDGEGVHRVWRVEDPMHKDTEAPTSQE